MSTEKRNPIQRLQTKEKSLLKQLLKVRAEIREQEQLLLDKVVDKKEK